MCVRERGGARHLCSRRQMRLARAQGAGAGEVPVAAGAVSESYFLPSMLPRVLPSCRLHSLLLFLLPLLLTLTISSRAYTSINHGIPL